MAKFTRVKLGFKRDPRTKRFRTWWGWRRVRTLPERIVDMAVSQLGTLEQPRDSNRGAQVERYQAATTLGGTGWPWCVAFTVWVRQRVGALAPSEYRGGYVPHLELWARKAGKWRTKPSLGARAIFDWGRDGLADHVGFVAQVSPLVTIEGNTQPGSRGDQSNGGGVYRRTDRTSNQIRGYVAA